MGLSKPLSFIAQHILPGFALDKELSNGEDDGAILAHKEGLVVSARGIFHSNHAQESAAARKIRQQHAYHPHYQHNLVASSNDTPSYSTPPSLSSSPTHSSPSSTVSSTSASHSAVTSPTMYHEQQYPYPYQLQSSAQVPYYLYNNSRFGTAQTLGPKGGYSYHRNQSRYQRRKAAGTAYYYVDDEEDMMVGYEGHYDGNNDGSTYVSDASVHMPLPQQSEISEARSTAANSHRTGSHSSQTLSSTSGRMLSGHGESSSLQPNRSRLSLLSNNNNNIHVNQNTLLPAIAETAVVGSTSTATVSTSTATATSRAVTGDPSSKTAQRSLRRIAQCSRDSDDWCSAKAGQYTRSYADTSFRATSYGEGRRMRRM